MSVEGFFRSLSKKVSQSLEEIKIKGNEASSDLARGMREIRDSTKAGVEKLGTVLQLSDTDVHLYSGVDETAGMMLAAHYSNALGAVHENNRTLVTKGASTADALARMQQRSSKEHTAMSALIKQCESLPEIVSNVDVLKGRCELLLEKLEKAEAMLGDAWEDTVIAQISVWKTNKEAEVDAYRKSKEVELAKIEKELIKTRDAKLAEKRNKAIDRASKMENAESEASMSLQEELDKSIKRDMDEYLIYGFSAKTSAPSSANLALNTSSSDATSDRSPNKEDEQKLAAVDLPTQAKDDLEGFLGPEEKIAVSVAKDEEEDSPSVKVDDTTIDTPEV